MELEILVDMAGATFVWGLVRGGICSMGRLCPAELPNRTRKAANVRTPHRWMRFEEREPGYAHVRE
jgi:hypothetical protein